MFCLWINDSLHTFFSSTSLLQWSKVYQIRQPRNSKSFTPFSSENIGGFCTDRISSSGLKKETEKNWFLFVKKSRQIQMRQILASFSVFTEGDIFFHKIWKVRQNKWVQILVGVKKQKYLVKWIKVKSWREKTLVNAISNYIVAILV